MDFKVRMEGEKVEIDDLPRNTPIISTQIKEQITETSFSMALKSVKNGMKIQREGWNGKGLWVKSQFPDANSKMTLPYLYIEYPNGDRCPWLASQTDIMAEDWTIEAVV